MLMAEWTNFNPNLPEEYEKCKTMIVDLHIDPDERTLEKLEVLRKRSCHKLLKGIPLSESALVLFRLKFGSIILTWIVRIDMVQNIREALKQCVISGEYFKENDIISLELDGEPFMPMERVMYFEMILLTSTPYTIACLYMLNDRTNGVDVGHSYMYVLLFLYHTCYYKMG